MIINENPASLLKTIEIEQISFELTTNMFCESNFMSRNNVLLQKHVFQNCSYVD